MLSGLIPAKDIRQPLFFGLLLLLLVCLVYSPYLLSVSMFGIISLLFLEPDPRFRLGVTGWKRAFAGLKRYPALGATALFFLIVLWGGLYSSDMGYWLERLRIKVPLLALPLAVAALPPLSQKQLGALLAVWVSILVFTSIGVGMNYALNFAHIQELLKQGQSVPVPVNHVRFSLMMAVGVVSALWLYMNRILLTGTTAERNLIGVMGIFLFLFMHLLAVRSGLAVLYLSLGILAIRIAWKRRKWWLAISPLVILTILPAVMYLVMPSFKAKVHYMLWDRKMYLSGQGAAYSDSGRILSLQAGLRIWMAHPWLGTGPGDLREEVKNDYELHYGDTVKPIMPHNQWLSIAAGSGLAGLMPALAAFFFPLLYKRQYRNDLLLAFHLILFFSFLVENTIENAVGVGLYTTFLFILLSHNSAPTKLAWQMEGLDETLNSDKSL